MLNSGSHGDCEDLVPLVAGAKDGDVDALDRLCECCYDQVLRYFQQRIPAEAEDLTQRLFASLPRKLEGYLESGRFRAWLQGVAYHMFLTQNRSNRRRPEQTLRTSMDFAEMDTTTLFRTAKVRLRDHYSGLPPALSDAWDLFTKEYSHSEIAEELGITPGAAATRVSRARSWLIKRLTGEVGEDS